MKTITSIICLATFALAAWGRDVAATIRTEAQNCAKAVVANDYETVIRYTHPRVVQGIGGEEAMRDLLKKGMSQMRADGFEIVEATVEKIQEPKKVGGWMTSLVAEHLVLKVKGGKLHSDSALLAISEDEGKHWTFVDLGPITQEQFAQVFPELDGKISLPEKRTPVFKKALAD